MCKGIERYWILSEKAQFKNCFLQAISIHRNDGRTVCNTGCGKLSLAKFAYKPVSGLLKSGI